MHNMNSRPRYYIQFIVILICFFFITDINAGEDDEPDVWDLPTRERIFVGGNLGLQFGTTTFINVSPLAGFRLTNRLSTGIGLTYQYFRDSYFIEKPISEHRYGANCFLRFLIVPKFFLYSGYEVMIIGNQSTIDNDRFWESNYFLGAGYRAQIGERSFFNLMALYNFNRDSYIYNQDVIFRFSIEVGL